MCHEGSLSVRCTPVLCEAQDRPLQCSRAGLVTVTRPVADKPCCLETLCGEPRSPIGHRVRRAEEGASWWTSGWASWCFIFLPKMRLVASGVAGYSEGIQQEPRRFNPRGKKYDCCKKLP